MFTNITDKSYSLRSHITNSYMIYWSVHPSSVMVKAGAFFWQFMGERRHTPRKDHQFITETHIHTQGLFRDINEHKNPVSLRWKWTRAPRENLQRHGDMPPPCIMTLAWESNTWSSCCRAKVLQTAPLWSLGSITLQPHTISLTALLPVKQTISSF